MVTNHLTVEAENEAARCMILFRGIEKPLGWNQVRLKIEIRYGNTCSASVVTSLSAQEIRDLASYFVEHIKSLPSSEMQVNTRFLAGKDPELWFTPLYDFKLRALTGTNDPDGGLFSLWLMLSLGQPAEDASAVWLGCEIEVTVREALAFVERLNVLAREVESDMPIVSNEIGIRSR
jgi:hypothetical protein